MAMWPLCLAAATAGTSNLNSLLAQAQLNLLLFTATRTLRGCLDCKVLMCHIGYYIGYHMECSGTNRKLITESVSKPRDKFIKPN